MIVDGKHVTAGERIRLLIGLERDEAPPVQQELPLDDDDNRYAWKDFQREQEDDPHRAMAGILVAILCSAPLFLLLLWWLFS